MDTLLWTSTIHYPVKTMLSQAIRLSQEYTMSTKQLNDIHTMIQDDLATSRQLLALLEAETQSTETRDYPSLSRLLEQKVPLLERLKKNAACRSQWLRSMNQAATEENWASLLSSLNDQGLEQQWQVLKTTIEHCQTSNETNGKLINRGLNSHTQLLNIMRGNGNSANLYNAKGSTTSMHLSGAMAKA
ncbi:MAG: flagellar protein FlgN [Pseudomonadota bacterium]